MTMQGTAEEREWSAGYDDWFVVHTADCSWLVSTEMARHIERDLDGRRPPRWVRFVDFAGARVRILSGAIYCIGSRSRRRVAAAGARVHPSRSGRTGESLELQ
jgi:hypothetical protein